MNFLIFVLVLCYNQRKNLLGVIFFGFFCNFMKGIGFFIIILVVSQVVYLVGVEVMKINDS